MELKYRGIAYQPSILEAQSTAGDRLGVSRRAPSSTPATTKVNLRKPSDELVYRGVRYMR